MSRKVQGVWSGQPVLGVLLVLLCLVLLPLVSGRARGAELVASGSCGDDLTWTLDSEGVLTISGTGEMEQYSSHIYDWDPPRAPWYGFAMNIKKLVIAPGVTSIGDYAFYCSYALTSAELPDSITSIGSNAFSNCYKLTDFSIPDSVTSIGSGAFQNCERLTSIDVPDSVTAIGDEAFSSCISATSIILGNGVETIGDYAFNDCRALLELVIPDSVVSIGQGAFSCCNELETITLGSGVTTIDSTNICGSAPKLAAIHVSPQNETYSSLDGVLFSKDKTTLYRCPEGKEGPYTIPDGVRHIADYGFSNCSRLEAVTLPEGVETIGQEAFYASTLTEFIMPDTVTTLGDRAFCLNYYLTSVTFSKKLSSIGVQAFEKCYALTSLEIPDSVKTIGSSAFYYCREVTRLTLGNGLTTIGSQAFDRLDRLNSVVIPSSVTAMALSAFGKYSGDMHFYFLGDAPLPEYFYGGNGAILHVPAGNSTWTVPEWNGYKTVWYTPSETVTLGAAGSQIYIPTGVTTGGTADPNRVKRVQIRFWAGLAPEGYQEVPMEIPWGWKLFWQDTVHYDNRLAIAALALSSAIEGGKSNVRTLLDTLGFQGIVYHESGSEGLFTRDVTHAIASRWVRMDGEDWDIFAVVCRGTDFGNANDVFANIVPSGYYEAAQNTWERLQQYLLDYYGETELSALQDKNMKFFITGHSLGGAVANLMSWKLEDFAPEEDVFAYTFASPFTWRTPWSRSNIYNVVNEEDVVPLLSSALNGYRIGTDYFFYRENISQMNTAFRMLVNSEQTGAPDLDYMMDATIRELMDLVTFDHDQFVRWNYAHSTVTYMAYLLARRDADELRSYGIRKAAIHCPVDVEVYNSAGELVGRVVDDQVDDTVIQEVFFVISGDEKDVYMPLDDEYTFVLTGNDAGAMRYTVTETDPVTGEATEKEFSAVVLEAGKTMTSEAGGDIAPAEVQLFVVDEASAPSAEVETSGTETQISDPIPVAAITGIPVRMVKGGSVTLAGVIRPSYAGERKIVWELADPGTTGARLNGNVLTAPNAGTLTLTATVPGGLATGADFTQTCSITVTDPPALRAPSLLEWDGKTANWNFVDNASGFQVQLYQNGDAVGEAVTTSALSWDFSELMTDETADYTFTVTSVGDGRAYSDSGPSEASLPYCSVQVSFRSVSDGAVSVRVQLNENFGMVELLIARYDNGRMTAAYRERLTASGIVEADLSAGSGTEYRAFLVESGAWVPLCEGAEY